MTGESELAFVATMRDEASREAANVRRSLDRVGGATKPITTEVKVDGSQALKLLDELPRTARGTVSETSAEFYKLPHDLRAAVLEAESDALSAARGLKPKLAAEIGSAANIAPTKFAAAGRESGEALSDGVVGGIGDLKGKLGPAIAAVGLGALVGDALGVDAAVDKLGASLGATPAIAARYGKLSAKLYSGAWGESTDDVNLAIASVKSSIDGLGTGKGLESASIKALDFASIFEVDVSRAAAVAGVAIKSGLADNATQAFDLLTAASQRVPVSLREDVLDATEEYGQFFNSLGFDGEKAFSVLVAGAAKGTYGIDKAGDAIKEFTIRSTDMSTTSKAAYKILGLNAKESADAILAGGDTAQKATGKIVDGLLGIQSPSKRANAAIALFGTPIEDLNVRDIPAFLKSLRGTEGGLGKVEGASKRAGDSLNDNASTEIKAFARSAKMLAVDVIGNQVLPALKTGAEYLNREFGPAARMIVDVVGQAADVLDDLPGPLKSLALQGGLAALALPKITAGLDGIVDKGTGAVDTLRSTEGRLAALKNAAKLAAGVGGLMLVTQGAQETSRGLGILESAAGGALAGSAAGPWGALIGGTLAGGLRALKGGTEDVGDSAAEMKRQIAKASQVEAEKARYDSLRDSLDQLTGAYTDNTRATVYDNLVKKGAIATAAGMGISARQLVDASLAGGTQLEAIVTRLSKFIARAETVTGSINGVNTMVNAQGAANARSLLAALTGERDAARAGVKAIREKQAAVKDYGKTLDVLPKRVRTQIEERGIAPTRKAIAKLVDQYDLTDGRKIRAIIEAAGAKTSVADIRRVIESLNDADDAKTDLPAFRSSLDKSLNVARGVAKREANGIGLDLTRGTRDAKADTSRYQGTLTTGINTARAKASTGGREIGNALSAGTIAGFAGTAATLGNMAAAAVAEAIRRGRSEGKIHSPSQETFWTGQMLGRGLTDGMDSERRNSRKSGQSLVGAALHGITRSSAGFAAARERFGTLLDRTFDRQLAATEKRLRGKLKGKPLDRALREAERRDAQARRAALKGLSDEFAAIKRNAAARDGLVKQLKAANDYANGIRDAAIAAAAVSTVQAVNEAPITAGFIAQGLAERLAAIKAFRKNLAKLRERGVDKSVLKDLEAQGFENGGAYAAALAAGTRQQIADVNKSTKDIRAEATKLGEQSVAGVVRGIEKELGRVDKVGRRLAKALIRAIRKELDMHSPSRVLEGDGRNSVKGLANGILAESRSAEDAAREVAGRVALAAKPSLSELGSMAALSSRLSPVSQASAAIVIRHEVVSPDGSVSTMTADRVADLIARDPVSAAKIESALRAPRRRRSKNTISASS